MRSWSIGRDRGSAATSIRATVQIVDSIPLTPVGKIDRKVLRSSVTSTTAPTPTPASTT